MHEKGRVAFMGLAAAVALEASTLTEHARAQVDTSIEQVLERYEAAWESLNPARLVELGPRKANPFASLADYDRFDDVRQAVVALRDVAVSSPEPGAWNVELTKIHEEVFHLGTVSRGIARVALRLRQEPQGLVIVEHKVLGSPIDQSLPYASANPATWGSERSDFERALFKAYRAVVAGQFEAARQDLTNLLAPSSQVAAGDFLIGAGPYRGLAHYLLAHCLAQTGTGNGIESELERAVQVHPAFPLALNELGHRAMERGDIPRAQEYWSLSLAAYGEQPNIREQLAFATAAMTHYAEGEERALFTSLRGQPPAAAVGVLKELLRRDRTNVETRRRLAVTLLENHDAKSAEKVLLENEYYHPTDVETQYLLGRAYLAMDRIEDSLKVFARVWKDAPGHADTLVYLVELNGYLRRYRTALSYLAEGLERSPEDPRILLKLGVYSLKVGRRFEGYSYLRRARDARPPASIRREVEALLSEG